MTTPTRPIPAVPAAARPAVVAALSCLALLLALPGHAATTVPHGTAASVGAAWVRTSGGPNWTDLTPAQHEVLAPLASEWNGLDVSGKEKWLEVANRFPRMKSDEQARVRARMVEWVRMTPQQRSRARLVFQENRDVSKEERQALWQQYQALPEDKKQELAQKELARRGPPASGPVAASAPRPKTPAGIDAVQPKSNLVRKPNPSTASPRPVAPVVVQARPGATTTLVNRTPRPPSHQKEGEAKIAVGENEVDRTTLLPRKGPQRAGATPSAPAAPRPRASSPPPLAASSARPAPSTPAPGAVAVPATPAASHP